MTQIYDTVIKLSLVENGVLSGISALVAMLARGTGETKKFESALGNLKLAAWGAAGAFAGFEALKGMWDIAKGSKELLNQQDQLRRAGVSNLDVLRLTADAYDRIGKAIPTAAASDILKTFRELRAVTGTAAGAEALTPKALMVDALLSNTFGKESHGEYYRLLRAVEMKGIATDAKKLEEFTDKAFSYITAFGGKLTAQDFQTFARRGGAAFINADIEKSMGPMAVLMADLGGNAARTAAMTLHQMITGATTLSKQQAEVPTKSGMLDMSKVATDMGGRLNVQPGGIVGSLEHRGDMPGWIRDTLMPHLQAISGGDDAVLESLIAKVGRNRKAQKLIDMFGMPGFQDQIAKDLGLAGQVKPIGEAYQSFITKNPVGVEAAYEAQKKSMLEAIGSPIMQAAIPVMQAVTAMFEKIGTFSNAHPEAIKLVAEAVGVLSATMVVLGGGAVIGAMAAFIPGGAFAVGSAAVAAVVGTLAALNWTTLTGWINNFEDAMAVLTKLNWNQKIIDWIKSFGDAVSELWAKIKSLNPFSHTSYQGGGIGGGGGIANAAWSGGGGGVIPGGTGGGDVMGAVAGSAALRQYLATGGHGMNPQTTAWCAAYVGAYLNHHGYQSLASNVATSYLNYGSAVTGNVQAGDVVVLPRGHGAGQTGGHVGIATGRVSGGRIEMLAGNTGHRVAREWENLGSVVVRRPPHHLPARRDQTIVINHITNLDGKQIAQNTVRHLVKSATYATSVGRQDGRGTFMGPALRSSPDDVAHGRSALGPAVALLATAAASDAAAA